MAIPERGTRQRPRLWALPLLMALNVLVFLVEIGLTGGMSALFPGVQAPLLVRLGANHPPSVWDGEIWRLLASAFLHGNLLHIALNLYGLNILGKMLEPVIGGVSVLVLYAGSAIVGSAASVAYSGGVSVGASGAVFGFLGALLSFTWLARDKPPARMLAQSLVYIVAINLGLGWFINRSGSGVQIDNYAHVGGLVGGMCLGLGMLGARRRGTFSPASLMGHGAFALVVLLAMGQAMHPRDSATYHASVGRAALETGDLALAERHADAGLVLDPYDAGGLALKVDVCRAQRDVDCTERMLALLLRLDPLPLQAGVPQVSENELLSALNVVGVKAIERQDWELASRVLGRAARLAPEDASTSNNYAWSLLARGNLSPAEKREALEMADRARRMSRGGSASINHTMAEALHQNGRTDEAVHLLERMIAGDLGGGGLLSLIGGDGMDDAFLRGEIERMRREAVAMPKAMAPVGP